MAEADAVGAAAAAADRGDVPAALARLSASMEHLDMTTEDLDFGGMSEDIARFAQAPLVKDALESGVDLRQYARKIESDLEAVEWESVSDYLDHAEEFGALHRDIQECDKVLGKMESMLGRFQNDLGDISSEIKSLQDSSFSMNVRLTNRRAIQTSLAGFLTNMILSPALVRGICELDVGDQFMAHLVELNKVLEFNSSDEAKQTRAAQDVQPNLVMLRDTAVAKARTFLLAKVAGLRKPNTNVQIMQQNVLLKYAYLNQFLAQHSRPTAEEVAGQYAETMSVIFLRYFKTYISALKSLCRDLAGKADLLGASESSTRSLFGGSKHISRAGSVFALGDRAAILADIEADPIIPHVAQSQKQRFSFEVLFRSMNFFLMDLAVSEWLFTVDFFGRMDLFEPIFASTEAFFLETLESYLFSSYDALGILLMCRVTEKLQLLMAKRRVPCLDAYFDRVNMLLWPRFKLVLDLNLESVKTASAKVLMKRDSRDDDTTRPHYVTRRYAEFVCSLYQLNGGSDDKLQMALSMLRRSMQSLLMRMSLEHKDAQKQIIFMINNYDAILGVIGSAGITADEVTTFNNLLGEQISAFVEAQLYHCFRRIIDFVKQYEALSDADLLKAVSEDRAADIVSEFARNWQHALSIINQTVTQQFPNFKTGMEILKKVLTQLVFYYVRFTKIVRRGWPNPRWRRDIIEQADIILEVKRYIRTFD